MNETNNTNEGRASLEERNNAIKEKMANGEIQLPPLTFERISESINNANNQISSLDLSESLQNVDTRAAIIDGWNNLSAKIAKIKDYMPQYIDDATDPDLKPYIDAELKDPMYNGKDLKTLMIEAATDEHGEALEGELITILLSAAKDSRERDRNKTNLTRIVKNPISEVLFPVDKLNNILWYQWHYFSDGCINVDVTSTKDKKKNLEKVTIPVSVNFVFPEATKKELSQELTPFDGRVYFCLSAAFYDWSINPKDRETCAITFQQLFRAMGGKGSPTEKQIVRLRNSVRKMILTSISIDTYAESQRYDYEHFCCKAEFLLSADINNNLIDDNGNSVDAIFIKSKPILSMFSFDRKQYTTIDKTLYSFGLRLTDKNIAIEDYIIRRISWMKNANRNRCNNIITFDAIADFIQINPNTNSGKRAFYRLKAPVKTILEHLKSENFINDFTLDDRRIIVKY